MDWLKNQAGIIENLDNPSTVRHDQVVCLELARLVWEFEGTNKSDEWVHHEQYPEFLSDYKSGVIALVAAFDQFGKLFLWRQQSYWTWTSRKEKDIEFQLYTAFLRSQLWGAAFTATMHKTILNLFKVSDWSHRKPSITTSEIYPDNVGNDTGHIINDYVFPYESSTLTLKGSLCRGNKVEILDCIVPADLAHVLDGAVLISIFRPESAVSQTSLFRFTPKRLWSMRAGYILNKNS